MRISSLLFVFFVHLVAFAQDWKCFPHSENAGVALSSDSDTKKWRKTDGSIAFYRYLSVRYGEKAQFQLQHDSLNNWSSDVALFCPELNRTLPSFWTGKALQFEIPSLPTDITIHVLKNEVEQERFYVDLQKEKTIRIQLVPLLKTRCNTDSISTVLNQLFESAHLNFKLEMAPVFKVPDMEIKDLKSPSVAFERYTQEMIDIRTAYLQSQPKNSFDVLIFIVPGFEKDSLHFFSVRDRSLGFVQKGNANYLIDGIARSILLGPGARYCATLPEQLTYQDWKRLRRKEVYSNFRDYYEILPTTNGMVAYYFWEEDALGNIVIGQENAIQAVKRPYKQNTYSYHLEITRFYYKTLFYWKGYRFNLLHFVAAILVIVVWWVYGRKVRRYIQQKWHFNRLFRFLSYPLFFAAMLLLQWGAFKSVNWGYRFFEVNNGEIKELKGQTMKKVIQRISHKNHPRYLNEKALQSEIVVKNSNGTYDLKQRQPVLYFEAVENESGKIEKLRLTDAKNEIDLPSLHVKIKAKTHYFVVRFVNSSNRLLRERVFNYQGIDLTNVLQAKDPPKRILVFVNGYRATSLGGTLEENFNDVKEKGLEFPNSNNHLYDTDIYSYWNPWNKIDERFKTLFAPQETYYADGHFSVSTSNYKSLVNFTTTSTAYPKRCAKGKPHHCYFQSSVKSKYLGAQKKSTYSLIQFSSNKRGFQKRFKNGRVAGKNLLAMMNELPNSSKNDTLFIVAHSMGYAYALGMIEELRGKIQFGSFIILAPENAKAGKVRVKEWKEIWQYGSNNNIGKFRDAPCLQDGVAPQSCAAGLPANKRLYIPTAWYKKKGFFDSHFVGYYTWIFDIAPSKPGHIKQH